MANSNLEYCWVLILIIGTISGLILASINLFVPRKMEPKEDSNGHKYVEEKHRFGISLYIDYPVFVAVITAVVFIAVEYRNIISEIGHRWFLYILAAAGLMLVCLIYVFTICALMMTIEMMVDYFIRAHYGKKCIKVIKDTKYFNV